MAPIARSNLRWALALSVAALALSPAMGSAQGAAVEPQSLVSVAQAPSNGDRAPAPPCGVRPLGREAAQLLAEARRLSPTVRRLLTELDASDLIVFVEFRIPRPIRTGQLGLVGSAAGVRYVRIEIFGVNYVKCNIPWLAHELQHAVEIASAPEVTDDAGVRRLYERIGRPSRTGQDAFETAAAIRVRYLVLAELASERAKTGAAGALTLRQPPDGR